MAKIAVPDWKECADGPVLVAVTGDAEAGSGFRLGTREVDWHHHVRGQVLCVENGLFHVRTRTGSWLLPPGRAGWLPPGEAHWASTRGVTAGWSLLIAPEACRALSDHPRVMAVSDVTRALVRRAASWGNPCHLDGTQDRVAAVLLDEIQAAREADVGLPMPRDARLLRIAEAVLRDPDQRCSLEVLARRAGMSARNARRLLQAETGMSFGGWRRQAGLVHAMEWLARGETVAQVSDRLGYAHPSTFIALFRRVFGDAPGRYVAARSG